MVWIRRVRTASGSTAVQIAESVEGRRRIVRHVGSARDDAELGLLIDLVHGHLSAASFVSCRHFVLSNNIRRSITDLLSILARAVFSIFAYNTCKSVVFSIKRVI